MIAHLIYIAVTLVIGGYLGYRYGSKVQTSAQAEVKAAETVTAEVKKSV